MAKNTIKNRQSFYKERFLVNYVKLGGRKGEAAFASGVSRRTVDNWIKSNKEFAALFEDAREDATEILEAEAHRRAIKGVSEPIYYKGEKVGAVQKFSDTLLIVLLKANAPDKYRENIEEKHTGEVVLKVKYDDSPGNPGNTPPPTS